MVRRWLGAAALATLATFLLLWLLGCGGGSSVGVRVRYVATGGRDEGDCSHPDRPCHTIQYAVDVARPGEEVRVATGTYTGVSAREGVTQVVYISKTVALRGGYSPPDWSRADPQANPTVVDAQGLGRALYLTGTISPSVEGIRVTGGDATGLGGSPLGYDGGGGIYVADAMAVISGCHIYGNTASSSAAGLGGGVFLLRSRSRLQGNLIGENVAGRAGNGMGGGLALYKSQATLVGNTLRANLASVEADGWGGGAYLCQSAARLERNIIIDNIASPSGYARGGGLYLEGSAATLDGNHIAGNTASQEGLGEGGGVYAFSSQARLENDVVARNRSGRQGRGSGLALFGSSPRLIHVTIAQNEGGDGAGIYVDGLPELPSAVALTNTIVASHTVGIRITAGNRARLDSTLWWANGKDWEGEGSVEQLRDYAGDPRFSDERCHIGEGSAALDRGVESGVATDLDGDARPRGQAPDLGADEGP